MNIKLTVALLLTSGSLFAQTNPSREEIKRINDVADNGTLAQKESLVQELLKEAKASKNPDRLETIGNYVYYLGKENTSDSLRKDTAKKYPKSKLARSIYISDVYYKQKDALAKEKSYKQLLKQWPHSKDEEIKIAYDYVLGDLTRTFMLEGNKTQALAYLEQMNERFWAAQAYMPVANILLSKGDTIAALPLIKKSLEDAEYYINLPKEQQDNRAGFAAVGHPGYVSQLADIYSKQGKHEQVLKLIEDAIALKPENASSFSATYFKALDNAGRKLEALQQLEIIYKTGSFTYKPDMKSLYTALNGSDKGFDAYLSRLDKDVIKGIQEHIVQYETFKQLPDFELLNLKGEKVSLASLKGKVLVLDFWATWCGPCVRSFPAMQAAQEMYANDKDVQFLFINTWERDKNYKENVASFISKNNYPFEVLYDDQKDPESGKVLAAKLGINGIPAKFIVDKDGNIRYSLTGSSSDIDYIKLEMKELVESAKKDKKS
jgi:thiol-disulfide isomerase/thioredoxin